MSVTTILIIVAVVVVVGAIAVFALRGNASSSEAREAPRPAPEPKPIAPAPKAEPKATKPEPVAATSAPAEPEEIAPEPEPEPEPAPPEPEPEPPTPPKRKASAEEIAALKTGLSGTRGGFIKRLAGLFRKGKELDPSVLDEMEEVLITADIGVKTADSVLTGLRTAVSDGTITTGDQAWSALQGHAHEILTRHGGGPISLAKSPTVILVVGVNGVGKTTTIGKLASRYKEEGKEVLLAAGDTFRAAAVLQLEVWGRKTGCQVVKGKDRADPGSVIFDAVKKAQEIGADVVIADTAGRLHTKTPLMEELKKVGRTVEKALERPADEVLLVLDATTGQNAIQQAELFGDALEISGIALTKLDGTAKGGVILGIVDQHAVPVRYIGIGERVEDLKEFEAESFVEALFERPPEDAQAESS
ncbi:MAG: signal recognition particle-docking protein FtsY [Myxococcota bacterium]